MRISEVKQHGIDLARATTGYVRSAGLHASELYGDYYKAIDPKRYDKRDKKGKPLPMDLVKVEAGTAFEEVLEEAIRRRIFNYEGDGRPGEFTAPHTSDCPHRAIEVPAGVVCVCGAGIVFSPDYLFFEGKSRTPILGEFKCTWYSTKGAPNNEKFAKWWTQIMLYSFWLGLTRARLIVFFVNGNYAPPSPMLRVWEAVFTRHELQEETETVLRHARKEGLLK